MRSLPHVHGIFCLTVSDRPKRDRGCPFYIWTLTLTVGARFPSIAIIPESAKICHNSKNRFSITVEGTGMERRQSARSPAGRFGTGDVIFTAITPRHTAAA